ncbi:Putative transposase [Bradyrhizobium sp. ORS 285]|uniref:IS66-like element accessory protein TnpA n=1 Tax=Bradyrhizobium sp. ORS 285 TaxID=115808 RepID=UPI000B421A3B|nr:Putative transposase [Bradyrhizobium sp. ORS 285]
MDRDKDSARIGRLEVVETGRRRRWSEDEKLRIVMESLQGSRQVSATARRYGISRSLLLKWRRLFRAEQNEAGPRLDFVPATVIAEPAVPTGGGAIEIELAAGARMRITGVVDEATLKAAVAALTDGRTR